MNFTFLLGLCSTLDGVDGSSTGLVFRLLENFLRFRFNAANAPNPSIYPFVIPSVYNEYPPAIKNRKKEDQNKSKTKL